MLNALRNDVEPWNRVHQAQSVNALTHQNPGHCSMIIPSGTVVETTTIDEPLLLL